MLKARIITAVMVSIISAMTVFAGAKEDTVNLAVKGLTQKLQADLAMKTVNIKLDRVENQNVSKNKVIVTGFGVVENANNLPVTFNVSVNPVRRDVVDVKYDIVEPVAIDADSATETFLMKKVMGKVKTDYKTNDIVMAIDGFQTVDGIDGTKNYVGVAEIRVDMEWNRIEFTVEGNAKTGAATSIKYKPVEK